ncbi:MAG: site-specific DNA-methyltransferase [Nitratireductor sp.]|uniref:DNA methyltransferase n=1 Tax=Nitratireductor sp. TaxID=1872084 RepID=UPI00260F4F0D|nr:DNA methyltransferase [Nitratireductor sp.]MCV0351584.1 site-specific DNA-methyltransferase [Nitratireductor sp.]
MNDLMRTTKADAPVECLGMTFPSEDARREHFLGLLAEKLKDPAFRKQEGFPDGTDEAILAMSDPPYYTACPNPWLEEFVRHYGAPYNTEEIYSRGPFAADVNEGRSDAIYNAHSYHTKVPPRAIVRYLLNYTNPGDLVFDGFCGTGMTAAAAQLCADRSVIQSLGYRVDDKGVIFEAENDGNKTIWREVSKLGPRRAIINDLSPAATFISYNYNRICEADYFSRGIDTVLIEAENRFGWMFQTLHNPRPSQIEAARDVIFKERAPDISKSGPCGRINYIVWSDIFSCPECAGDLVFWNVAVDRENGKIFDQFKCPHCDSDLSKRDLEPKTSKYHDPALNESVQHRVQIPAYISYTFGSSRYEKQADDADIALAKKISEADPEHWYPSFRLKKGDKTGEPIKLGITHTHHFYTHRCLTVLSYYRSNGLAYWAPFSALTPRATRMHRIAASRLGGAKKGEGGATVGIINGTLYVPSLSVEMNVMDQAKDRLKAYTKAWFKKYPTLTTTQSSTNLNGIPENSVDYVFIDPPFGSNLMYSELNALWEGWLQVFTKDTEEAIENKSQGKQLDDYRRLMTRCFREVYRILKPGRWATIEFSNTQASVWNSIQTAIQEAGLVVANVSALNKKQGSFNAVTNPTSVKQDLIISAYKPNGGLEERFRDAGATTDTAWDFIQTHLRQLPVTRAKAGILDYVTERDPRILFDRMVAWFVQHNSPVPLSSQEFQADLQYRFALRDGMVFLPEQVAEYDRKRAQAAQAPQMELFVSDERSAIDWLAEFLRKRPSTYQEMHPEFTTQLGAGWRKHEERPELSALLADNFLRYDGNGDVPSQIHSYLSTNFKDLRGLEKDDPRLKAKAKDRWFVPDPSKAKDLEQKRERSLLKEFESYKSAPGRRLKEFRLEVLRAGFKTAWAAKDYKTIIGIAQKIPEEALQEDEKLLLWYDQALTRMEADA